MMPYADPLDPRARASRRKHYEKNKEQYKARNKTSKELCLKIIREAKAGPCMDCGQSYPYYVMDFDHRDPSQKSGNINEVMLTGERRLREEIDKCDVVCSNCHRKRTHGR